MGGYYLYVKVLRPIEVVGKTVGDAKEAISKGVSRVAMKARDILSSIQEAIRPGPSKSSEELPKTVQAASDKIEETPGGANSAVVSYWEWVKKKVEKRIK